MSNELYTADSIVALKAKWPITGVSSISNYDNLSDSLSKDLEYALIVDESHVRTGLGVHWKVTSLNGSWNIGPGHIADEIHH